MMEVVKIPLDNIQRMEVYENSRKLSLRHIVEEQQPDIAFTAVFYNSKNWAPVCPVKAAGKVLYQDKDYDYWALAWDEGSDVHPALIPRGSSGKAANYVANCLLVREGKPQPKLYYGKDVGGDRGRVGVALKDRQLYVLGCEDGMDAMTPEELRDLFAGMGCEFAIMMDGGRKVNFYCRQTGAMLQGKDPSQTLVLIYLKKEGEKPVSEKKKVCLDAGHSASNKYNKSPDGSFYEHEFALDMAKRMKTVLELAGVEVIETRPDDGDVSLGERCRISNAAKPDLFVSIHSNATGTLSTGPDGWGSARGWEAYVYGLSGARYKAAQAILSRVEGVCPAIRKTPVVGKPSLYVLANTSAPAVLIEHGFHTNKEDVGLLKDTDYRGRLAIAEACGILDWLGVPVPEDFRKPAVEEPAEPAEKSEAELAVEWITGTGIMLGDVNGDLMLDQPLTRKQFAVMLYRYAQQRK